ncbi:MAG TPA: carboxypeptidase-like regulatory domain-containing protein [Vicinamibacterales bacterium]|nr:carboxypeptidase-like regulatory domain-containing protein [Vicinamibacterales bacterium]
MRRLSTLVVAAALVCFVVPVRPAAAQAERAADSTVARAGLGSIRGLVLATDGRPLVGAMVSALGSTVAFVVTGRDGRFLFDALPAGPYTVRVHLDGFAPSVRRIVEVRPEAGPSIMSVALKALASPAVTADGRTLLAAGVIPLDGVRTGADASSDPGGDYDYGETAWRLRHLKRGVLKGVETGIVTADAEPTPEDASGSLFGRAFGSSMRAAASLFTDFPLTGQVNLLTTSTFGAPFALDAPTTLTSSSIALVSLGSTAGPLGDWAVSAAMTPGQVGSWFVDGTLTARPSSSHRYVGGLVYGAQRVNSTDLFALSAMSGGSRSVGRVYGFDEWIVSKYFAVGYGLSYMWQDYVATEGLVSPRVSMTVSPVRGLRLRAVAARNSFAPGSEEFINVMDDSPGRPWLPAHRSFSPWSERDGLHAQTTDHLEFGVERDVAAYVVGVRTFYQSVDNQAGAIFAAPSREHPAASLGHYYLASLGDFGARGWGVKVSRPLFGLVRGSVDYSVTTAQWVSGPEGAGSAWFGGASRAEPTRVHDVTTSFETAIAPTSTHVYVLYKLNSGFARQTPDEQEPGFAARFDIQVNQALPFMDFTSADWEVLVAVCNLFRDAVGERSIYDELLVIRPPKRVVGGVRVRF